ncbi:MAG: nicotinate-nucleotide adenylyltransferase [Candidatus Eisenbacteria sp.]|nr:nicotinate-nucleotide adenylyltransferase [Candidatus Eisenbacteria bacterium]
MKLGILGGTFDPPHRGHLVLAERCAMVLGLDRVLFVPSFRPPHKPQRDLSPFAARVEMTRLAIADEARFQVLALEENRGGPSYTVDMLADLLLLYRGDILWLLLGQDSLIDLPDWKDPQRILSLVRIAVYGRPGVTGLVPGWLRSSVTFVEGPLVDISSRELRMRVRQGDVGGMVAGCVLDLIRREGLYAKEKSSHDSQ